MSSKSDLISWQDVVKKTPHVMRKIPGVIKGLKAANLSNSTQPVGLGWTLERAVDKNPHGLAIAYQDVRFSYLSFNAWVNRIAHYLMSKGIGKGDVVAISIENRPELLAVAAAVAKVGAIGAMMNTSQSGKVLIHSYNLVQPKAAVIGQETLASFAAVRDQLAIPHPELIFWLDDADTTRQFGTAPDGFVNLAAEIVSSPVHNPESTNHVFADDACFYIYTSGTTGMPKAGICKHARWMKSYGVYGHMTMGLNKDDIFYNTLPLYHATGLCVCWGAAMSASAGFAIRRKFSASNFWNDIRTFNASAFGYVGELCRYLMNQPTHADDRSHRVKKMIGNGLRPNIWLPFKERFGIAEIYEIYAASDGNIGFTNALNFDNTVGFSPVKWALVEYDKEAEQPVRGQNGFMHRLGKGGTGLLISRIEDKSPLDGYTDPEKTKAVILCDVFENGDRWFNTGDMMRSIGFGHLQFVDRLGDTYRWKGENVSTTEVENLVCAHPHISEAVAYGVEIPNTNGRAGMVAITPSVALESVDFNSLLEHVQKAMPAYAVPLFLRIKQQMDTTGTFKYKKSDLKDDGFDISKTDDPIYVLLPGAHSYAPMTGEILAKLNAGQFRF